MKENKEEKEWQFLGYSQIKHTLSPGDFVSVNINEKGLIVIDATEIEEDTPQTPEWEKEKSEIGGIICQCGNPINIDRVNSYWIKKLSQTEERGRRRGIEEVVNDVVKMADKLESDCNLDGDKGIEQWRNFKGFRNTIRDRYLKNLPNQPLKT